MELVAIAACALKRNTPLTKEGVGKTGHSCLTATQAWCVSQIFPRALISLLKILQGGRSTFDQLTQRISRRWILLYVGQINPLSVHSLCSVGLELG